MGFMETKQIGYARVSAGHRDRAKQRRELEAQGVPAEGIFMDDRTGTGAELDHVISVCRRGDTFVVMGFERLAGSLADAAVILGRLLEKGVVINLGGKIHDPADLAARRLPQDLLLAAALEAGLIPREESPAALDGRLRSKIRIDPAHDPEQEELLVMMVQSRAYSVHDVCALFGISRTFLCAAIDRRQVVNR